jgi:hypothetical protein
MPGDPSPAPSGVSKVARIRTVVVLPAPWVFFRLGYGRPGQPGLRAVRLAWAMCPKGVGAGAAAGLGLERLGEFRADAAVGG